MKGAMSPGEQGSDASALLSALKERAASWRRSRLRMQAWELTVLLSYALKRLLDLAVSSVVLVFGFPFLLLLAILVKLSSRGSSLFVQTRVGYMGRHFLFYKFRSMRVNRGNVSKKPGTPRDAGDTEAADDVPVNILDDPKGIVAHGGVVLRSLKRYAHAFRARPDMMVRTKVSPKDPNITLLGRFLRKTSLDEFPQFFNVFLGDMSLVGPRPPVPSEVRKYSQDDRKRLNIKPGLTCLWQIKGRSDLPFDKQLQLDKEYIQSQSLCQDFLILLKTVPAIIIGRGAY